MLFNLYVKHFFSNHDWNWDSCCPHWSCLDLQESWATGCSGLVSHSGEGTKYNAYVHMRRKTDQVCETIFATQKKVKLTGSRKTNVSNQKRQEWTAKTPAQAAPRPEAEEVFWSLPTPWGRRASLGNSTWLSPCWSSWRRWRCLWWWRSTRRSPWPASTTCPTGSTWSGCRQTLTRQTWRTPQTRKRVFLLLYIGEMVDVGEIKRDKATNRLQNWHNTFDLISHIRTGIWNIWADLILEVWTLQLPLQGFLPKWSLPSAIKTM